MSNKTKYLKVVSRAFNVEIELVEDLNYQDVRAWDSVGHMALAGDLEDTFEIEMDIEDIIDFSSIKKGYEILSKYGVEFE
jgi:acyl carrier protein